MRQLRLPAHEPVEHDPIWKTAEGRELRISEMTDGHLINAIRMLCHLSPHGTNVVCSDRRRWNWVIVMTREAQRRGLTRDVHEIAATVKALPPMEDQTYGKC